MAPQFTANHDSMQTIILDCREELAIMS